MYCSAVECPRFTRLTRKVGGGLDDRSRQRRRKNDKVKHKETSAKDMDQCAGDGRLVSTFSRLRGVSSIEYRSRELGIKNHRVVVSLVEDFMK